MCKDPCYCPKRPHQLIDHIDILSRSSSPLGHLFATTTASLFLALSMETGRHNDRAVSKSVSLHSACAIGAFGSVTLFDGCCFVTRATPLEEEARLILEGKRPFATVWPFGSSDPVLSSVLNFYNILNSLVPKSQFFFYKKLCFQ